MNQWLQFSLWLVLGIGTLVTVQNCVELIVGKVKEGKK